MTKDTQVQENRLTDEEYQRRIDADPSVKRLSRRATREREKAMMSPEERNPKGAGRKRMPQQASAPSLTMRIPDELAEDMRKLIIIYRDTPEYIKDRLHELVTKHN